MKRVLKKIFNAMGFDVVRYRSSLEKNLGVEEILGYEFEDEATVCIDTIKNNTMLSKIRLVTLYQYVAYCERYNIPGSYVECGVWKGGATGMMALANMQVGNERRHLHLFYAFQEICEPDATVDGVKASNEVRQFTGKSGND